ESVRTFALTVATALGWGLVLIICVCSWGYAGFLLRKIYALARSAQGRSPYAATRGDGRSCQELASAGAIGASATGAASPSRPRARLDAARGPPRAWRVASVP